LSLHVWVYLHSNLCSGLQKTHLFCTGLRFGRSRLFRVIQGGWFWYQSKARMRLSISPSLWLWSYLAPCLRYGDLLAKKLPIFPTPLSFGALAPHVPFGILRWSLAWRNQSHGAILQWRPMMIAWVVLTQFQRVTDRRTDGRTDGFTIANTALCIASYSDAL